MGDELHVVYMQEGNGKDDGRENLPPPPDPNSFPIKTVEGDAPIHNPKTSDIKK